MSTDSKCDCSRSLSTNPIARLTSRGRERNLGRRLACSLALAAFGVLVAPETAFAQAEISNIRTPDKDFENLEGDPLTSGIWSNGEVMWVADSNASNVQANKAARIYAYDMETKARVSCNNDPSDYCKDFADLHPDNTHISAIWSDGDTMWVADWAGARIYAYSMETKTFRELTPEEKRGLDEEEIARKREATAISDGFNLLRGVSFTPEQTTQANVGGWGLWSGTGPKTRRRIMWVSDIYLLRIFAYDMETKAHVPSEDFECVDLLGGSLTPRGIWADRRTMWVVSGGGRVWAFNRSNGTYDSTKSFDAGSITGASHPRDIWSDGTTMWLAYEGTRKTIHAFDLTRLDGSQAPPAPSSGVCGSSGINGNGGNGNGDVLPVLSIEGGRAIEGEGATVTFTVTLAPQSGRQVTVNWATSGGTATQNQDYQGANGTLTFSAGETSKTIAVEVTDDSLDEPVEEAFTVQLTSPSNATLSPDAFRATGTIVDDDGDPSLSIGDARADEGTRSISFTVSLIPQSTQAVSVSYDTRDGTAIAGEDYIAVAGGTLSFSAGQTSRTITVTVTNDTLDEDEEMFEVVLSNPVNAGLAASATATGTIEDNDNEPSLSISNVSASEADGKIDFTVRLNRASGKTITVDYETSGAPDGGTAIQGTDYTRARGTLSIPANTSTGTISVLLRDDSLDEDHETFTLELTGATNASLFSTPSRNTATGTIEDDDDLPVLSIEGGRAVEADGAEVTFTVTLAPESGREVAVNWATSGDTATHNQDYQGDSGTLTFSAGETSKTIAVEVTDDSLDELVEEEFTVRLTSPRNATLSPDALRATGTIVDDDGDPSLSIGDARANEGTRSISFTVSLIPQSAQAASVSYDTRDGTAIAGEDYVAVAGGTLSFSAGQTSRTITVTVTNDTLDEDEEMFEVVLSNPENAELAASATATGTIEDNDNEPSLSISNVSASEADGKIDFTVRLNRASGKTITVDYETTGAPDGGTAIQGTDYTRTAGTLTFNPTTDPPETEKTISVPVSNDALNEVNETFTVTLSNAMNATLGSSGTRSATGTIQNDDPVPALLFTNSMVTVSEAAESIDFEVQLDAASGRPVTVRYQTRNGTATAGQDYTARSGTLLFEPGLATPMTVSVPLKEDSVFEGGDGETFELVLRSPSNATVQLGTAIGTITDNDSDSTAVELTVNPETISEGAGTETVTVTASLNGSVRIISTTVTVTVTGSGGTNVVGFQQVNPFSVTIPAGSRSGQRTFSFRPDDNNVDNEHETVTVTGVVTGLTSGSATITLRDNDDTPTGITLSVQPRSISEGAGARTVTVTAWLDGSAQATNTDVTVNVPSSTTTGFVGYSTSPSSFVITIPDTSVSAQGTFMLTPSDDEVDSADSTVTVTGTVNGQVADYVSSARLTVTDNDSPSTQVTLSVDPNLVSEDDGSTQIDVTATLNRSARTVDTVVGLQLSGSGNANVVGFEEVTPFSITIPVGTQARTGTFTLIPVDNEIQESSETLTLSGSTVVPGLNVLDATLVLNDDDGGTPGPRPPGPRPPGPGPQPPGNGGTVTIIPDSDVVPGDGDDSGLGSSARAIALGPPLAPTPAKIVIWTDQNAYQPGNELMLYRTMDPMGDENQYTLFFYRENIETGERRYFAGGAGLTALGEEVVDHYSMSDPAFRIASIEQVEQQLIWSGFVPGPGLWHFVAELRSPDTTQVLKRAHAKFVVARNSPVVLGEGGSETEIATDTTWINDTIYKLRGGVTVKSGATLTIEPGTVIQAMGADVAIIVEKGGRIVAQGRREAPVVITCDANVGERESGCWGGLIVRGNAPVDSDEETMNGTMSEMEPLYGGDDPDDSSGVLRFVRVEFAGGSSDAANRPASIGFHGVGSGTVIDHVQAHEGSGDGIAFRGGTAHCGFCVSSGSLHDSLDWAEGWRGTAQHVYIQQGPQGEHGIEAIDGSAGSSTLSPPRPAPYNVTLVGGASLDEQSASGDGIRLESGATLAARNVVLTGFGGSALDVQGDSVATFMAGGASSLRNAILHANGSLLGAAQIKGGVDSYIDFTDTDPMLRNIRYEGNPDPRPKNGSAALEFGASAIPPSDGTLSSTAEYIGAFGVKNWLEEWTFFGAESEYNVEPAN